MKPEFRKLAAVLLLILFSPSFLVGHTNLFYPGDAYFSSALYKDTFARDPENPAILRFGYLPLDFMPCGEAGYGNLTIRDPSGKLRTHLKAASDLLWFTFAQDAEDWGGMADEHENYFPFFVYNRDFNPFEETVAIKFNERWEEIQLEFGVKHAVYNQFDEAPWMRIRDIQNAKAVPPLKLTEPAPPIPEFKSIMRDIDDPVVVDSSQIQIVFLVGDEHEIVDFANSKPGLTMVLVTESGITRHEIDRKEKWQSVPLNAPRNNYIDRIRAGEETAGIVSAAIKLFVHRHGWKSFGIAGLQGLVQKPEQEMNHPERWTTLLHEFPKDPWGRKFRLDDQAIYLVSFGPNGKEEYDEEEPGEDDEYFRLDRE